MLSAEEITAAALARYDRGEAVVPLAERPAEGPVQIAVELTRSGTVVKLPARLSGLQVAAQGAGWTVDGITWAEAYDSIVLWMRRGTQRLIVSWVRGRFISAVAMGTVMRTMNLTEAHAFVIQSDASNEANEGEEKVAETVAGFPAGAAVRSSAQGPASGGRAGVDWSKYTDGQVYKLTAEGGDFPEGKAAVTGAKARAYGKRNGRRSVEWQVADKSTLYVKFGAENTLPAESAPVTAESAPAA